MDHHVIHDLRLYTDSRYPVLLFNVKTFVHETHMPYYREYITLELHLQELFEICLQIQMHSKMRNDKSPKSIRKINSIYSIFSMRFIWITDKITRSLRFSPALRF